MEAARNAALPARRPSPVPSSARSPKKRDPSRPGAGTPTTSATLSPARTPAEDDDTAAGSGAESPRDAPAPDRARSPSPQREDSPDRLAREARRSNWAPASPLPRTPSVSPSRKRRRPSPSPPRPRSPSPGEEWRQPSNLNPVVKRDLVLEYWERSEECTVRKKAHLADIDRIQGSREDWIMRSVLHTDHTVLEPNPFPYTTPRGIEHWTLWSVGNLNTEQVESFVVGWIEREKKEVVRWNFDWNEGIGSIDVWHIHVYFQTVPDDLVDRSVVAAEREAERRKHEEERRRYEEERGRKRVRWDEGPSRSPSRSPEGGNGWDSWERARDGDPCAAAEREREAQAPAG
ncbi:hypothetical protein DFJ74DRAFT_660296 [Hyaloraphidium curvatum]|nr:hypothetical protein DFJ74DRAFT_660296 [Hyaloraphidium curvatum]